MDRLLNHIISCIENDGVIRAFDDAGCKLDKTLFFACGSTALGVVCFLHDNDIPLDQVLLSQGEYVLKKSRIKSLNTLMGITASGNSAEVMSFLCDMKTGRRKTLLLTGNESLEANDRLVMDLKKVRNRHIPLYLCLLLHHLHDRAALRKIKPIHSIRMFKRIKQDLCEIYLQQLIPVFVSERHQLYWDILSKQYMEYFKKPSLYLCYPEYTHNFIWSLNQNHRQVFAFIHLKPRGDLPDNRFKNAVRHIDRFGIRQVIVEDEPGMAYLGNSIKLMEIFELFDELSSLLGLNGDRECSFEA